MPSSGKRSSLYVGLFTACALAGCIDAAEDTEDTEAEATTTEALTAQTSTPEIPGMTTSSNTRSGRSRATMPSASRPFEAVVTA